MSWQTVKNFNMAGELNLSELLVLTWALVLITGMQALPAQAQLTELYAFQYNAATTSNFPDGANPMAELIQGADGDYYTTTNIGGAGACPGEVEGQIPGCGAVVKITPAGALSVLYSFPYDSSSSSAPNGWFPEAGLVQGRDGNFYGVASEGGTATESSCADTTGLSGCGTVFKLTPSGTITVLHSFCGGGGCGSLATDGAEPTGRMVFGANGDLYGTTQVGGLYNGFYNQGMIFRITTSGLKRGLLRYDYSRRSIGGWNRVQDDSGRQSDLTAFIHRQQRWQHADWGSGAGQRWQPLRHVLLRRCQRHGDSVPHYHERSLHEDL
jgi:uncharacterized repeat protein (TIGR03803 family)